MTTSRPLAPRNARVKHLAELARRRPARAAEGAFVVEGPKLVLEALDAGLALLEVFATAEAVGGEALAACEALGVPVWEVPADALRRALDVVTPQPVAAVVRVPAVESADRALAVSDLALGLLDVSDPGNAGTLMRTAEAAGAGAVVLGGCSVDPFSPKSVRASAGAVFRIPVVVESDNVTALERMGAAGLRRVGTRAGAGTDYDRADLTGRVAIVLGSEAHGLPGSLGALLDETVAIPMAGPTESLNVAAAGAVVCFEVLRQRRAAARAARP
ncbi:MAG: RNA methyltransferase [Actinobacteria bacterium]|nr:RNA methyltransferase [Actinomycetota bacterium]